MINKQFLDNLFKKQAEKDYKYMWVLHSYLGITKANVLSISDRQYLMDKFKICESFLDKAIVRSQSYVDISHNNLTNEVIFGTNFCKKFKVKFGIPYRKRY